MKDGSVSQYWESIAALITEDTVVVKSAPCIEPTASGPMKAFAVEFYKNGKLLRNKIKNHPRYPYHLLREEMQEFILDKLQLLIERKLIKGIGENGTEYTVIAQILDLPKEILRLIQKFDFTKKNPKLIYINTGETMISLQDSILVTFLNLAGFDILFFVPTGYQSVENYFAEKLMEEHQIGEYKYDMQVPDLNNISTNSTRPHGGENFSGEVSRLWDLISVNHLWEILLRPVMVFRRKMRLKLWRNMILSLTGSR